MDSESPDELGEHFAAVVLELAPDGIAVTDESGRIVHANSRFEVLFGYPREHLVGRSVEMLLPEPVRARHLAHRADYAEAPVTRPMGAGLDLWALHADGSEFPVEIALSPVTTSNGIRTIMVVRQAEDRRVDQQALRDRAVLAEEDRIAMALNADVIRPIFAAGLGLHGLLDSANPTQADRIRAVIDQLDDAIRAIRRVVFDRDQPEGARSIDLRSADEVRPTIEYCIDDDDVLVGVGGGWAAFASENDGADLAEPMLGRSLWSSVDGLEVQAIWQLLVARVRSAGVEVRVPFRCDAPTMRRWFEMRIIPEPGGVVRFRSTLDHVEPRLHVTLSLAASGHETSARPLEVCCGCERVREGRDWLEIEDVVAHLRLLGEQPAPTIARRICPACEQLMMAEAERAIDASGGAQLSPPA
ncbi:MAG: PAS domain S-box protein [Acidimicrobiales bacterium]